LLCRLDSFPEDRFALPRCGQSLHPNRFRHSQVLTKLLKVAEQVAEKIGEVKAKPRGFSASKR
jgi:hypothetical protein